MNVAAYLDRIAYRGPLDPTFNPGTGITITPADAYVGGVATISALAVQADNKLLIGGMFNQYNGTSRVCLARLAALPDDGMKAATFSSHDDCATSSIAGHDVWLGLSAFACPDQTPVFEF